jgi:hypothetical protein
MPFFSLSLSLAIRDDDLSEVNSPIRRHDKMLAIITARFRKGEGEYIGGIIDSPIASIEVLDSVITGDDQPNVHRRT